MELGFGGLVDFVRVGFGISAMVDLGCAGLVGLVRVVWLGGLGVVVVW